MLQAIRDRLVGWLLWVFIGVLIVPFAFWGIESFRTDASTDQTVAKVGEQKITQRQLSSAYDQRYRQMQSLMGDSFRPEMIDQPRFRSRILEDLVQEELLRQRSQDEGYQIPDSVLVETVHSIPVFQEDGKFSATRYRERLAEQGATPEGFEARLRESLAIEQLRDGVLSTAFVTNADVAADFRTASQTRGLAYVVFNSSSFESGVSVSDEQVKARYEERKAQFMAPERIKLAYVELALDQLPKAESPGAEALKAIYETEKATRFSSAEEREARHILVKFGSDKAAAKQRAEALLTKIRAGGDFAALAKAESEDGGSKKDGGSLGWVKRGQMVKGFEDALFGLDKGKTSDLVETEFGWHLIKLDDVRPPATRSFDDKTVQAELLDLYQRREAEKHFQDKQERLEQLAFENPASLDAVAKDLGVSVQTSDWVNRAGGAGIAANPAVLEAAFSEGVVKSDENSKPITLEAGRVVVVRKSEYEAPRQKTLEEVTPQVRAELVQEAARAKAASQADALVAAVGGGKSLEDAAKAAGQDYKSSGLVKRNQPEIDPAILKELFKLSRPEAGASRVAKVTVGGGNVAVLALSEVKDADLAAAAETDAKRARDSLRDAYAGMEFNAYRSLLKDATKVDISEKATIASAEEPPPL